jgi:hypothetical protein
MLVRCHCCTVFGIAIYNGNAIIDDNFDVYLNGTLIGSIDNNLNDFTGRLWSPNESDFTPDKFGPRHTNAFQSTLHLDTSLLITGSNTLRIVDTQENLHGNFGIVQAANWRLGETTSGFYDIHPPALLNTTYGPPLGTVGSHQDFTFTYP